MIYKTVISNLFYDNNTREYPNYIQEVEQHIKAGWCVDFMFTQGNYVVITFAKADPFQE